MMYCIANVLYLTSLYTILHCTILYSNILYPYCTVLYPYCTLTLCTVQYRSVFVLHRTTTDRVPQSLCSGDDERSLKVECYDWNEYSAPDLIGECYITLAQLKKSQSQTI